MIQALSSTLAQSKSYQIERFNQLKSKFSELIESIPSIENSDYVVDFWKSISLDLIKQFSPHPPLNFFCNHHISGTMYSTNSNWAFPQLEFLKGCYPDDLELKDLLEENPIGDPLIIDEKLMASCNNIHHLYHYRRCFSVDHEYSNIVEWGGGYGHLPIMFDKLSKVKQTYTIIDLPIFSCVQWLYLGSILGEDKVNILTTKDSKIIDGKINLIPITLIDDIVDKIGNVDLFVAMWSLSESSAKSYDLVTTSDFFNSKHVMMGFHGHPCTGLPSGNPLLEFSKGRLEIEDVGFVDNHYYSHR